MVDTFSYCDVVYLDKIIVSFCLKIELLAHETIKSNVLFSLSVHTSDTIFAGKYRML